ncbi:hypothetical protein [Solicola sp. PLA-1-18]|uniref:hypothetical protein n=1 Tax=Solicola sp. PLA-1-18 TaxID=3380532 RepID=UPI003B7C7A6C
MDASGGRRGTSGPGSQEWQRWLLRAQSGDGAAAAVHARRTLDRVADATDADPEDACWALYLAVVAAIETSDLREAHRAVRELIIAADSAGEACPAWRCLAEALRALAGATARDTAVAYDLAIDASLRCEDQLADRRHDLPPHHRFLLGHTGVALAACWVELGVHDLAERWIDRVDVLASHDPMRYLEATATRLLGELLVQEGCVSRLQGDDEMARSHFSRCIETFGAVRDMLPRDRRYASYRERAEVSMSALAMASGRRRAADRQLLEDHVGLRTRRENRWSVSFAHAGLAIAADQEGDLEAAGRHTAEAVGEQAGVPMSPMAVFLLTEHAAAATRLSPATPATTAQSMVIDTFVAEWSNRRETRLRAGRRREQRARELRVKAVDGPDGHRE